MHWEIVTRSGIVLTEQCDEFLKDTKQIKECYFTDGLNVYGIDSNLCLILNNTKINLKEKQEINKFFQYKSASHNFFTGKDNITYHLGVDTNDNKYTYKYIMHIYTDSDIVLEAQKILDEKTVDYKKMKIL